MTEDNARGMLSTAPSTETLHSRELLSSLLLLFSLLQKAGDAGRTGGRTRAALGGRLVLR